MSLPVDLVSQFAKLTKSETTSKKETTVYGEVVEYNGTNYVRLDGSDLLTPVVTTVDAKAGDRVTVLLKNHTATVTGNITSPAARTETVNVVINNVSDLEKVLADVVTTDELNAAKADIANLKAADVTISNSLSAANADIDNLQATNVTIVERLDANDASIQNLQTNKLSAKDIEGKYANIDFSNIGKAAMEYFYSNSGLIENVVVGDGIITGKLVGVTISGNLIEGNTVKAEKLVIKGTDGLYYKLNTDGMKTEAEQTEYNSLNGSVIIAKSITASKISVSDLVAFDATIGGFNITDSSIYSGVKESIDNTTSGIYLDKHGQMAIGDGNNFIRYYKDQNEEYHLEISAQSVVMSVAAASELDEPQTKDLQTMLAEIQETAIGRNKILWSGGYYMSDTQTATLSEAISAQPHGIVLLWSYCVDGASDDSNFRPYFIPKRFVASHPGKGVSMFMTNGTMNIAASKYVYISDTSIKGHANNNEGATTKSCGITSTPTSFVLRYVIGV